MATVLRSAAGRTLPPGAGFLTPTTVSSHHTRVAEAVGVTVSLAGIAVRASAEPDATALVDDSGELTWAQVADQVDHVAGELLAVAGGAAERGAVIGENTIATLVAHAAGILSGVGTVAVSRQLKPGEMADQFADAGVVAVVTGPLGLAAASEAAQTAGAKAVVVHGVDDVPAGAV